MRTVQSFRDAEQAIAEIYNFIDEFRSHNVDIHGRRVINAGHSVDGSDYVIRDEIKGLVGDLEGIQGSPGPPGPSGTIGFPVSDDTEIIHGNVTPSKRIRFEVDGLTANTLRVLTVPDANFTIAGLQIVDQTFTKRNIFLQPTGATIPAVVIRNEGSVFSEDVLQVQNAAGTPIFKIRNENDPTPAARNSVTCAHIYPNTDDLFDLGAASVYWRSFFVGDIQIANAAGAAGLGITAAQIAGLNRTNAAQANLNWTHMDATATLYIECTANAFIPGSNNARDLGTLVGAERRWRTIYGNDVDLSNNKYVFWRENPAGTARACLGLGSDNDFNVGVQAGVASGGDLILYANGEAFLELDWTATGTAAVVVLSGKGVFLGQSANPFSNVVTYGMDVKSNPGPAVIGTIAIFSPDNTKFIGLRMTNGGVSYNVNFPASQGGANTFLRNDGSGNLSWNSAGGSPFDNDTYLAWKDTGGTARNCLGLDGSNHFHVGLQVAPISGGDLLLYRNGIVTAKLSTDGAIEQFRPDTNKQTALGTSAVYWRASFIDGLTIDTAGIKVKTDSSSGLGDTSLFLAASYIAQLTTGNVEGAFPTILGGVTFRDRTGGGSTVRIYGEVFSASGVVYLSTDGNFIPGADEVNNLGSSAVTRYWNNLYLKTIECGKSASSLGSINLYHNVSSGANTVRCASIGGGPPDLEIVFATTTGLFAPNNDGTNSLGSGSRRWRLFAIDASFRTSATGLSVDINAGNRNILFYDAVGTNELAISVSAGWGQVNLLDGGVEKIFLDANNGGSPEMRVSGNRVISTRKAAVADPSGGSVIDVECRAQLSALLARVRVTGGHGLIAD